MNKINRVLFIGSKQLGFQVLREMHTLSPNTLVGVLTIDDSNDTRTELSKFQYFSKRNNLSLHIAKNREESEKIITNMRPDLCIVVGWYLLIGKQILDSVPFGFIGIHNSLLPKYRGGSPLIWSIINNDKEVGFSFFSFTEKMDEGNIWAQGCIPLEERDFISGILNKLEQKIIDVFQSNYLKILNGKVEPIKQNHELATYCSQRYPDDGNINWNKPVKDVYNFIRAQSDPYPGAFTYLNRKKLTIWKALVFDKPYYGTPGQVANISGEGVYVICGNQHAILIQEVEIDGKRGAANEFIKSIKCRMSSNPM